MAPDLRIEGPRTCFVFVIPTVIIVLYAWCGLMESLADLYISRLVSRLTRDRLKLNLSVIHPRLAALGVPSEVRDPSGIVNTSWDRLPAFCMWDLLFCVFFVVEHSIRLVWTVGPRHSRPPQHRHATSGLRRITGLRRGLPVVNVRTIDINTIIQLLILYS